VSGVLDGLAVDSASDRAVFRQIADHLSAAIHGGRLGEGDQLPSEAQLIDHYRVARMTVRNAMQAPETEGLIGAEQGAACSCGLSRRCAGWHRIVSPGVIARKARQH
jgi:DNA-binding transcriptional MocR family regulator